MFRLSGLCTVLLAVIAVGLVGCGESDATDAEGGVKARLSMVSGSNSGTYFPTAVAIGKVAKEEYPDLRINVSESGGSVANANMLRNGEAQLAMMQSDIANYAFNGLYMFSEKYDKLTAVAAMYPEHIQVFATKASGIQSIADLKGKRVAIGAIGSGSEANALQILEAYGMTPDDFASVERLGSSDARDYMQDGRIDAAFFSFAVGSGAITEMAERTEVTIVPISGAERSSLLSKYPFYQAGVVPAGSYKGVDSDVETLKLTAVLVADASVEADVIQALLESMFKHIEDIHNVRPVLKQNFKLEDANKVPIDLHPGAKAFFDEKQESTD